MYTVYLNEVIEVIDYHKWDLTGTVPDFLDVVSGFLPPLDKMCADKLPLHSGPFLEEFF